MSRKIKRILHIAPQNISDVPMTLVRAERALGYDSRLVTFFRDVRGYPEDFCLNLPFVASSSAQRMKKAVVAPEKLQLSHQSRQARGVKPVWRARNVAEFMLIRLREWLWLPKVRAMMNELDFWNFDLYQFDAGLDFFRDGRTVRKLKRLQKRVNVLYTGSDFRTRGVIAPVDALADARFTVEWDHLELDSSLQHVLFPFEPDKYSYRERDASGTVHIGHAPTNRAAKGSDVILHILAQIATKRDINIILIENKPHKEAIALKDKCDIFIDQIGDLGYGINALEALAMGIPTCSALTHTFAEAYPSHPFMEIQADSIEKNVIALIDQPEMRRERARNGRAWVEAHHDSRQIAKMLLHPLD